MTAIGHTEFRKHEKPGLK